ncbi:hypothetical protein [Micromonospora sp. WMMD714]|uniref:hypothetical protein n=1 Tax=Micromonospora sp. WMMD714 TaxID=3016097 RepID=UPI00249A19CA|nr:hypothetical protein [Micromonospora sp. WMMD714]WFE63192.1 hypothetical protein O7625_07770 [Micromonospora sp. WMMD714]
MAMVNLPAARRHHSSRIRYAFGLLALIGTVTTLVVVTRYPAESATRLAEPVPAPEITVVERDEPTDTGRDDPADTGRGDPAYAGQGSPADARQGDPADAERDDPADAGQGDPADAGQSGVGGGAATVTGPRQPADDPRTVARSLFYSGLLGLVISLAGLGLVGTRRRMW